MKLKDLTQAVEAFAKECKVDTNNVEMVIGNQEVILVGYPSPGSNRLQNLYINTEGKLKPGKIHHVKTS